MCVCVCVGGLSGLAKELMTEFADSLPGIDEAKSFMQVMRFIQNVSILIKLSISPHMFLSLSPLPLLWPAVW